MPRTTTKHFTDKETLNLNVNRSEKAIINISEKKVIRMKTTNWNMNNKGNGNLFLSKYHICRSQTNWKQERWFWYIQRCFNDFC